MSNILQIIIKKSLDLYDEQNEKNKEFIEHSAVRRLYTIQGSNINDETAKEREIIYFGETSFNYEILCVFDLKTRIWAWSWLFPLLNKKFSYESRQLLNYALDKNIISINDEENIFIKTQLTNSRLYIPDSFQLDIMLALCSYLLQDRIKFIYPEVNKDNSDIILFILVK